ncbi:MAG: SDR family NAD(P)-dependent oxidoreductase [Geminicoccaceae bacterium]
MGWDPRHVLITGASSGIGAALARRLARPGRRLTLLGRDAPRLDAVAAACAGEVVVERVEVRDAPAMARAIERADAAAPIDLLIANAGISGGDPATLMAVNVQGIVNTVEPALAAMRRRGAGQIALMSSLAGFRGLPNAPAYCASKGAVRLYGEGLRGRLAKDGIGVSVICPGFIRTPLTAGNPFPMPFLMEPAAAAERIVLGLARNRARIAFPQRLYAIAVLTSLLPATVVDKLFTRFAAKE